MKQILFQDKESGLNHVGILMDDGDVICGCCGGLVPADEVNEMVTIIEIYDKWIYGQDETKRWKAEKDYQWLHES